MSLGLQYVPHPSQRAVTTQSPGTITNHYDRTSQQGSHTRIRPSLVRQVLIHLSPSPQKAQDI